MTVASLFLSFESWDNSGLVSALGGIGLIGGFLAGCFTLFICLSEGYRRIRYTGIDGEVSISIPYSTYYAGQQALVRIAIYSRDEFTLSRVNVRLDWGLNVEPAGTVKIASVAPEQQAVEANTRFETSVVLDVPEALDSAPHNATWKMCVGLDTVPASGFGIGLPVEVLKRSLQEPLTGAYEPDMTSWVDWLDELGYAPEVSASRGVLDETVVDEPVRRTATLGCISPRRGPIRDVDFDVDYGAGDSVYEVVITIDFWVGSHGRPRRVEIEGVERPALSGDPSGGSGYTWLGDDDGLGLIERLNNDDSLNELWQTPTIRTDEVSDLIISWASCSNGFDWPSLPAESKPAATRLIQLLTVGSRL